MRPFHLHSGKLTSYFICQGSQHFSNFWVRPQVFVHYFCLWRQKPGLPTCCVSAVLPRNKPSLTDSYSRFHEREIQVIFPTLRSSFIFTKARSPNLSFPKYSCCNSVYNFKFRMLQRKVQPKGSMHIVAVIVKEAQ